MLPLHTVDVLDSRLHARIYVHFLHHAPQFILSVLVVGQREASDDTHLHTPVHHHAYEPTDRFRSRCINARYARNLEDDRIDAFFDELFCLLQLLVDVYERQESMQVNHRHVVGRTRHSFIANRFKADEFLAPGDARTQKVRDQRHDYANNDAGNCIEHDNRLQQCKPLRIPREVFSHNV